MKRIFFLSVVALIFFFIGCSTSQSVYDGGYSVAIDLNSVKNISGDTIFVLSTSGSLMKTDSTNHNGNTFCIPVSMDMVHQKFTLRGITLSEAGETFCVAQNETNETIFFPLSDLLHSMHYTDTADTTNPDLLYLFSDEDLGSPDFTKKVSNILYGNKNGIDSLLLNGMTPLMQAVVSENKELTALLIGKGAKINQKYLADKKYDAYFSALEQIKNAGGTIALKTPNRFDNALSASLRFENTEIALMLLKAGAVLDINKDSAFDLMQQVILSRNLSLVKMLYRSGLSVNKYKDPEHSPIYMAAYYGDKDIVEYLIQNGADINITASSGQTLFGISMFNGFDSLSDYLIKKGIEKQHLNECLVSVCNDVSEQPDNVAKLLKAGASVNLEDSSGRTVLMTAASKGYNKIVSLLCSGKANVNKQDNDGKTALMYCAEAGNSNGTKVLINHGAKPDITDNNGDNVSFYHDQFMKPSITDAIENNIISFLRESILYINHSRSADDLVKRSKSIEQKFTILKKNLALAYGEREYYTPIKDNVILQTKYYNDFLYSALLRYSGNKFVDYILQNNTVPTLNGDLSQF